MINRIKQNYIGIIGLVGCLVTGAIDGAHIWLRGPKIYTPLGRLASWAASQFAAPPSLTSAGSDYSAYEYWFYLAAYSVAIVVFALLFWLRTRPAPRRSAASANALLAMQLVLSLCAAQNLLFLLAAELPVVMPLRRAAQWVVLQVLSMYMVIVVPLLGTEQMGNDGNFRGLMIELALLAGWQAIAFAFGHMASVERRGRIDLAATNAELRATQLLLADTVRATERMRIARDLHDIVGHHLTALNLHLDLALRQADSAAPPALHTSRELAHKLLAEVRVVVGSERSERHIDLREALLALCAGIPAPQITLQYQEGLDIASAAVAHTLFCCVQEAISNAVRHAGASALAIEVAQRSGAIEVQVYDDGRGNRNAPEGNGLRGMRERLATLGGELTAANRPARGFGLQINVPMAAA
ncbi:MAG: histidine kinase [Pseudomonadota bacterium]